MMDDRREYEANTSREESEYGKYTCSDRFERDMKRIESEEGEKDD